MFSKKVFRHCQRCHYPLNPKFKIGDIGCCDKCGWAGSPHSQSYGDWVQLKVSAILIVCGLSIAWGIVNSRPDTVVEEEVQLTYSQETSPYSQNQSVN